MSDSDMKNKLSELIKLSREHGSTSKEVSAFLTKYKDLPEFKDLIKAFEKMTGKTS